jgi:hypothetical protein
VLEPQRVPCFVINGLGLGGKVYSNQTRALRSRHLLKLPSFLPGVKAMVKKAHIVVRLLRESQDAANDTIKAEVEKEIKRSIYVIPWANAGFSFDVL